jgi:formylglycine-generating enzyme required for sulfatase activity
MSMENQYQMKQVAWMSLLAVACGASEHPTTQVATAVDVGEGPHESAPSPEPAESEGPSDRNVPGDWVLIRAGTFTMGSPESEAGRNDDEEQHEVTLTRDFWLQATEVTQSQFHDVMGYGSSLCQSQSDDCPAENVSWHESAAYCNAISERAGLDRCYSCTGSDQQVECEPSSSFESPYQCPGYRLPTEAEWEYAARSGTSGARHGELEAIAWFEGNSDNTAHPVGTREASPWGLYDMLGNVNEWCHDQFTDYADGPVTDPLGRYSTMHYVYRGGCWHHGPESARAANRVSYGPRYGYDGLGFRPARTEL